MALSYLQQTLELEAKNNNLSNLADTYLNLCAVLSQLGNHEEALQKSLLAVSFLQDELLRSFLPATMSTAKREKEEKNRDSIPEEKKDRSDSSSSLSRKSNTPKNQSGSEINQSKIDSEPVTTNQQLQDRIAITAIAYHNMAVEFEYLNRVNQRKELLKWVKWFRERKLDEALKTYEKAAKFAEENLGKGHPTAEDLRKVCQNASRQVAFIEMDEVGLEWPSMQWSSLLLWFLGLNRFL